MHPIEYLVRFDVEGRRRRVPHHLIDADNLCRARRRIAAALTRRGRVPKSQEEHAVARHGSGIDITIERDREPGQQVEPV
jgi:hypothetical protein